MKIIILSALLFPALSLATIKVSVDRQPVALDESFQIYFESNKSVAEPDFKPLERDFDILSNKQSSQMTMINGRIESSKKWILDVMAKRHGQLSIPEIDFGKEKSEKLMIEVKSVSNTHSQGTNGNDNALIEVDIESKQPYVQEQVSLTVRLFLAVQLSDASLSDPVLNGVDAVIQKLGDDKNYETRRGNQRYMVYERRYAIFPQASGKVEIEPITFQGRTGSDSRFFNNFFKQSGKLVIKRSQAITLDVEAVPASYQGQQWLPARHLVLKESWPETATGTLPIFRVGEPVTRTIILQAEGLSASQLPELKTGLSNDFKEYPDQPALQDQVSGNSINGTRLEKIAIIPSIAGKFTLPEIVVPWWNTKTDQQEYARLPKREISVLAATKSTSVESLQMLDETIVGQGVDGEQENTQDSTPILETSNTAENSGIWFWLSLFFALAWLLTSLIWVWFHFRRSENENIDKTTESLRKTIAALKDACAENDPEQSKVAILNWAGQHWQDGAVTSLGEIGQRCDGELSTEIETLNRILYSKDRSSWDGKALWNAIKEFQQIPKTSSKENASTLEPLYRL